MDVFVHVGAAKTGTSAIQSVFTNNRQELFDAGIWYPSGEASAEKRASLGLPMSGNGTSLFHLVRHDAMPKGFSEQDALAKIEAELKEGQGRPTVYSSEFLGSLQQDQIAKLQDILAARGGRLKVIFYVRHLLDLSVAHFAQRLKGGRISELPVHRRTLDSYVASDVCRLDRHLDAFSAVLGPDRVICRLYDADKDDLAHNFLRLIKPDAPTFMSSPDSRRAVNRTPTRIELELFLRLNMDEDSRRLCWALSDSLLNKPPLDAERLSVTEAAFAAFADRNQRVAEAINRKHLDAATPVELTAGRVTIGAADPIGDERMMAFTSKAIAHLFAYMSGSPMLKAGKASRPG